MAFYLGLKKLQLRTIGNTLGPTTNFLYFAHHLLSKLRSRNIRPSQKARQQASELKQNGFVNLGVRNVDKMASIVNDYFQKNPVKNGMGFMDRKESMKLAPYLFEAISGPVEEAVNAVYGSHFQFYWITVMRYEGEYVGEKGSSFDYHTDDNPNPLLKIFFYLQDTKEENSAFRAFDYATSRDLFRRGFISSDSGLRIKAQSLINPELKKEKLKILEGSKGTALIFDNNLVHTATAPRVGYRDTINIEIYPNFERFDLNSVRTALSVPFVHDWPKNPFVNDLRNQDTAPTNAGSNAAY